MFKKVKTNKEAEREKKQKRKAVKQTVEKETKQRTKEEKKNTNLLKNKPCSLTEAVQPLKDPSISSIDAPHKELMLKITGTINERVPSVKNDLDQEQEIHKPKMNKGTEDQSKIIIKAKNEDTKVILEQQDDETVVKGRAQSLLFDKTEMASLGHNTRKAVINSDEETEWDVSEGLHLITPRKRVTHFFKMTDWIQKKMPQKINLRKKISALTKAVGITSWLRTLKQKQSSSRSRDQVFRHRVAMRIVCKTRVASQKNKSSAEDKLKKEKARPRETNGDATEEITMVSNKELDAKYAVVLPRVKKLTKAKTAETHKTVPSMSNSSGGHITCKAKPPKPGAKLVLPSKPDLSLLKSMKKSLSENLLSDEDVEKRGSKFLNNSEELSIEKNITSRAMLENQDGVSVLRGARDKLKPSQMSVGMLGNGLTQPKCVHTDVEVADHTQRSVSQCSSNEVTSFAKTGVCSLYEEEADQEVALLMGGNGLNTIAQPKFHWTGNNQMSGDAQTWLQTENLLPHQTVEKLTKWTVYDDDGQARTQSSRGHWESEDSTQEMAETQLISTQVLMPGNKITVELDEVEDLTYLEDVSESSVLLNLKKRFDRDCIYTYIGNILLSINPFKSLTIFSEEVRQQYEGKEQNKNPP
ncbi:uncharacterized protein LOC116726891 isoform X2 [Xiphophorus hellerii]|uniref:uncharacterized protein LOC116726891 isoform X2 n=1 Tax=Xiphophorus hellerii TaxID=8084 RepID=UPI0013B3B6CB|nr:uncharacterized protein LOC116726891 isoform X2 [Xiphophorus hellerii]